MLKEDFILTWPNMNPMSLSCPRHVQWKITVALTTNPVCTVPYVCPVQRLFLSYKGNVWGDLCNISSLLLVNNFIIYLQKISLDTTCFPKQKYTIPYHPTRVF